jgi:hypothetical protein
VANFTPQPLYPRQRNTVPNEQDNGLTQQLVWMDLKKTKFLALLVVKKILKHPQTPTAQDIL